MALGALEQLAVHADVVAGGVGLGAQHGDDLAVDLHAALLDHLLGAAAAGDTGGGENLLQALQLGGGTRLGNEHCIAFGVFFGFGLRAVFSFRFGLGFIFGLRYRLFGYELFFRSGFYFRCKNSFGGGFSFGFGCCFRRGF